jgi:hypothetical protein
MENKLTFKAINHTIKYLYSNKMCTHEQVNYWWISTNSDQIMW